MSEGETASRVFGGFAFALSLLQGTLLVSAPSSLAAIVLGLPLAFLTLLLIRRSWATQNPRRAVMIRLLVVAQLAVFLLNVAQSDIPFPNRALQVTIASGYVATSGMIVLGLVRSIKPARAALLSCTVAALIGLTEAAIPWLPIRDPGLASLLLALERPEWARPIWSRQIEPHPLLGYTHVPNTIAFQFYPDDPRNYFERATSEDLEQARLNLQESSDSGKEISNLDLLHMVRFRFNAMGCRGRDYAIPAPPGSVRILVLGDSYTLGEGVHEKDVFTQRLESMLNRMAQDRGSAATYEVINCGAGGYSTKEERHFYELIGARYEPNIVLLSMVWNDDRPVGAPSWTGFRPTKISYLFHTWYLIRIATSRPPEADYGPAIGYVIELNRLVQKDGARLAVILFRKRSSREWDYFVSEVFEGLENTSIPVRDLGTALGKHDFSDLTVHPIDAHPNEVAHRLAAEDVLKFLVSEVLVPSP